MIRTLFVAFLTIPSTAFAQFGGGGSGGGNQGGGQVARPGTATTLQSLSGSSGSTSGSTGTQSGSSFGSMRGTGQSSLFSGSSGGLGLGGSSGSGMNGLSGGQTQPFEFGQFAQALNNTGFVGGANANGFVGNRLAGQQGSQGFSRQAFQGFNRGGGSGFNNGRFGGDQPKLGIRPTLRVGFDTPTTTPTVATTRVTTRLSQIVDKRPKLAGVTATTDETGRLVLRGAVADEEARQLAAALARLEPGVGEVVNELTVAAETAP